MTLAVIATAALLARPTVARAHFILDQPASYSEQNSFGMPQKSPPCGQADPGYPLVETGMVTAYTEGDMLTVTLDETVFHPGHYRISIAPDQASLPADPPVTAGTTYACGTTVIDPAPVLPVLADGVFVHTDAFPGTQTVRIPLPAGLTCDHCVLQVTEFMSEHPLNNPGGCFYHHCANVRIVARSDAGTSALDSGSVDSGSVADARDVVTAAMDVADGGTTAPRDSGCGCRVATGARGRMSGAGWAAVGIAMAAVFARRRRRGNSICAHTTRLNRVRPIPTP